MKTRRKRQAFAPKTATSGMGGDFQQKWGSLTKDAWLRNYNQAFTNHIRNMGLRPIAWGQTIPLSPAQMEARRIAQNATSVLDFGCGRGFLTVALREEGANVVGIDPAPAAVEFAKSNLGGKHAAAFRQMGAEELAMSGETYACVIATEILELVQDAAQTIAVLWGCVEDGGFLVASFPRTQGHGRIKVFSREMVEEAAATIGDDFPARIEETETEYLLIAEKDAILIRYCQLVAATAAVQQVHQWESERRFKTGVTNWLRMFHGQVLRLQDVDPGAFDVVHIQLAGDSIDFPMLLRERIGEDSATKVMVNVDYPLERWHCSFGVSPDMVIRQLQMADVVFSQTRRTAAFLSGVLGRPVPYVPHPVEVDKLLRWAVPIEQRGKNDVVINTHYDGQHHFPHWIVKDRGLTTHLVGFMGDSGPYSRDNVHKYYTYVHERQGCQQLIQTVYRQAYVAFDHYTHNVQGRTTVEFAGLGIPCLGWDCVDAQVQCFPDLTFPVGDLAAHQKAFERLMEDAAFYEDVSRKAQDASEFYGFGPSKARFLKMIGYAQDRRAEIPEEQRDQADALQSRREAPRALAVA